MTREQFRLDLSDLRELVFERFSNVSMQSAPWLTQQCTVGRILRRVRRNALPQQQT
jgi:hypothetical protein